MVNTYRFRGEITKYILTVCAIHHMMGIPTGRLNLRLGLYRLWRDPIPPPYRPYPTVSFQPMTPYRHKTSEFYREQAVSVIGCQSTKENGMLYNVPGASYAEGNTTLTFHIRKACLLSSKPGVFIEPAIKYFVQYFDDHLNKSFQW